MKRTISSHLILLLCAAVMVSCGQDNVVVKNAEFEPHELVRTKSNEEVTRSVNDFAFDLLKAGYSRNTNYLVSPASLSAALSMAADGADGKTFTEMRKVLGLSEMSVDDIDAYNDELLKFLQGADNDAVVSIANSLWIQEGFPVKASFSQQLGAFYDAEASNIDFTSEESAGILNDWCSKKTKGLVPKFFDETPNCLVMLLNAMYFKAAWSGKFMKSLLYSSFSNEDGVPCSSDFICSTQTVPYYQCADFQLIELPLGNGTFTVKILLPAPGKSLSNILSGMNQLIWDKASRLMKPVTIADITIPKCSLASSGSIARTLQSLGMKTAFSSAAEFPFISDVPLCLSEVSQNARLSFDENGVEAAVVSDVKLISTSNGYNPEMPEFVANRPFIFTIEETTTGVILFAGIMSSL